MTDDPEVVFFSHVMKAGGTSLRASVLGNFKPHETYPSREDQPVAVAKSSMAHLASLPTSRLSEIRLLTVHMPVSAAALVPGRVATVGLLRDPTERAVSHLLQVCRRGRRRLDPETVYRHGLLREALFANHQVRMFAIDADAADAWDELANIMRHTRLLAGRAPTEGQLRSLGSADLDRARRRLDALTVLGVQDRFGAVLDRLHERFGWRISAGQELNVGDGADIPGHLRERIAEDNALDRALYDHAVAILGTPGGSGSDASDRDVSGGRDTGGRDTDDRV